MKKTTLQAMLDFSEQTIPSKSADVTAQSDEASDVVLAAVRNAIDALPNRKETAAAVCATRQSQISDCLAGREGRHFPMQWVLAIALRSDEQHRTLIARSIANQLGLVVAKPLTTEERLAQLQQRIVEEFGKAGAALVKEVG
jgi:hypothetical protein